jgi:twinkle protein
MNYDVPVEYANPQALAGEVLDLYDSGGLPKGDSTGWRAVDEFYTVLPGQWTVVTGIPQSGKSEWLDAMLVNLAEKTKSWQFVVYSPENFPTATHVIKILEKRVRKPFGPGPTERMTKAEAEVGLLWVHDYFKWLTPEYASPEYLLELAGLARTDFRKLGIVLDPWNTLDHERGGMSETDYISTVLTRVTRTVRATNAHVWLVVHPAKIQKDRTTGKRPTPTPYDISGSAHWYNKADNIVTVHRDQLDGGQDVEIHVQKVRFKHVGHVGIATLKYDRITGRYFDAPAGVIYDRFTRKPEIYNDPPEAA